MNYEPRVYRVIEMMRAITEKGTIVETGDLDEPHTIVFEDEGQNEYYRGSMYDMGISLGYEEMNQYFYVEYAFSIPGLYAVSNDDDVDPTVCELNALRMYFPS
jgi:hypothetical protein